MKHEVSNSQTLYLPVIVRTFGTHIYHFRRIYISLNIKWQTSGAWGDPVGPRDGAINIVSLKSPPAEK